MVKKYGSILLVLLLICIPCFAFADSDSDDTNQAMSDQTPVIQTEPIVLRVTANDTTGLHSIILSLIGDYNPIATVTTYQYPSGNAYQNRQQVDVTPDWSWIATCGIFAICVYSVFRMFGSLLGGLHG